MTEVGVLDAPIRAAQTAEAESRTRAHQAADALLEMTRQRNGNPGPSVVDDVARKYGVDPVTVQQSLWTLLASGRLATRENGEIFDPERAKA